MRVIMEKLPLLALSDPPEVEGPEANPGRGRVWEGLLSFVHLYLFI